MIKLQSINLQFKKAVQRFNEVLMQEKNEYILDSAIKRFEFTFDISWKLIKAYLEEKEGARWLVCSRCDTEWLFRRFECPYCNNNDQAKLGYFTDDKGLYRLYFCEKCRKYIKAIDLRITEEKILFPVERILTLDIDSQALAEGYEPGAL